MRGRFPPPCLQSSANVKGYAHELKDWFGFLQRHGLDWRRVQLEELGSFLAWLRLQPRALLVSVARDDRSGQSSASTSLSLCCAQCREERSAPSSRLRALAPIGEQRPAGPPRSNPSD